MAVALALLAIIVAPLTRIILTTESASDTLHLTAEAADLATQALETAQYKTANGVNPTPGITTSTQTSGKDSFTVAVDFELTTGTGTSSICIAPPGELSSQIWTVKATVTWGKAARKGKLAETTLISPSVVDLAGTNAAEIAVPVFNANETGYETTTPINLTITGTCTLTGGCGTVPGNEVTTESANTGSTGCAVFPGLFAGAGETYSVTASPSAPLVDPNELFYNSPASGVQVYSGISPPANQVTLVDNPNLILAPGATTTVLFQTFSFTGGNCSLVPQALCAPAPYLPISVQSASLSCSTTQTCELGNLTGTGVAYFSSTSAQTALLFPGPAVTGTTPNYSAWAGDQADSSPTYNGDYGLIFPFGFQAVSNTPVTIELPVYPLVLNLSVQADAGTLSAVTVTDSGGGDTMTLNKISSTQYAAGLPLGQFVIQATDTGSSNKVSSGSTSPVYVWILPTGVCVSTGAPLSAPCPSPVTSPIGVTVG